jgi:thymidylate synthase
MVLESDVIVEDKYSDAFKFGYLKVIINTIIESDAFCKCLLEEDIQLYDYQSHPTIKAPLSN